MNLISRHPAAGLQATMPQLRYSAKRYPRILTEREGYRD